MIDFGASDGRALSQEFDFAPELALRTGGERLIVQFCEFVLLPGQVGQHIT
jgi:hypothetical protein